MIRETLIISVMMFSASAGASTHYSDCLLDERKTQVCDAYLAGVEDGKQNRLKQNTSRQDEKKQSSHFLHRAVEQRAGGRYNASRLAEGK